MQYGGTRALSTGKGDRYICGLSEVNLINWETQHIHALYTSLADEGICASEAGALTPSHVANKNNYLIAG